jgi:hypothetical protein
VGRKVCPTHRRMDRVAANLDLRAGCLGPVAGGAVMVTAGRLCGMSDITADDFVTGLLAVLAKRGVTAISIRGSVFSEALAASFDTLQEAAAQRAVNPRFLIILDPVYQDSPVIREAISSAVQRNLVGLDNPEYQDLRIKLGLDEADHLLSRLPGGLDLYERIADTFLSDYRHVAA